MKNKAKYFLVMLALALFLCAFSMTAIAEDTAATPFYVGNAMRYADADDSLSATYLTSQLDNITMEAWVKADTLPDVSSCIRIMYNGDSGRRGYGIYLVNNNPCILMGGVNFASVSDVSLNTSQWYHLAAVRASGVWKLYINGAEYTPTCSTSAPNALAPTDTFTVGNSSYLENFTGSIDEVRFWTVARTADEIRNNMYVKLNGTESGLLAYYNFDQDGVTPGGDNTALSAVTDVAGGDQNLSIWGFALTGNTSNFVQSVSLGTFQIESTAYSVGETSGNVTIPLVRTGGREGSVTINYTTADGTAAAGTNYTATSGSVTFAETETSKSVQIPVMNQSISDSKTFTFSISGEDGISIGSNSSATVTITPGCAAPTVTATGGKFTLGAPGSVDLYSSVTAATNDDGQTFTGAILSVTYFSDTTEYLTVDGTDIPLINGTSGTFSGGDYRVTGTSTLLSVVLSGMALDDTAMGVLIDGIAYKNSAASATAGNRVITLSYVTDSGISNNQSAINISKSTVIVGNISSPVGETMDISACAGGDVILIGAGSSVTLEGNSTALTNVQIFCEAGVTLTLNNVSITDTTIGYSPVTFTGKNNTLIVTGENNLSAGAAAPGVDVSGAALHIRGTGSLTARGIATTVGYGGAGIGTIDGATYDINIESGNITAIAGATNTRGVKALYPSPGISAADISITGGAVTATGYYGGAGIGSDGSADGSSITISGGVVTATADKFSVGIGCTTSAGRSDDKIAISGGRVIASCLPYTTYNGISYALGTGIGSSFRSYDGTGGTIELTGGEIFAGFSLPSGCTAGGYDIGDANILQDNTNWTVSIGGSAKVFLFNNTISGLTTSTHIDKTYDAGTLEVYGITIPEGWQSAGFGAYLRPCTLTYNVNGGSGTAPDSVIALYDMEITLSDDSVLSRANYHFDGWNTAADGSETSYAAGGSYTMEADTTLYAAWVGNTYTVTYDPSCGTVAPDSQVKLYGSTYGKASDGTTDAVMPTPTLAGHTFSGWYTAASGGTKITDSDTVSITGNTAFYAQWTTNTYTVTYDPNGGTVTPTSQVKLYGSTYGKASDGTTDEGMPIPTWAGHAFSGWYTAASGGAKITDSDAVGMTENTTVYAQWATNTYTVTYDPNGGTVDPASQVKLYGSTYGKSSDGTTDATMPAPVWAGHTFSGWFTAASGGTKVTDSGTVDITENTAFYAQWTTNTYTVTYDPNGGTVTPTSQVKLYGSTYGKASDGSTDAPMPIPTWAGHTFSGWYTAASGGTKITDSDTVDITENMTFYAQWTTNIYTVTYDPSCGTVSPTSQVKLYGSAYGKASDGTAEAAMPTPTLAGHTFSGWYTAASGGTKVTDSDTVSITENTTLYAQWTTNTYTVTYDPNGGTVDPASQVKLYGSTYGKASDGSTDAVMPTPTWAGHTFSGWYTAASGGTKISDSDVVSITENTTFYAKWTTNTYTVTYDPNGGTVSPTSQVKLYGSTYGKASDGTTEAVMPTPVWAGHTFSGWYTAASGGVKITDSDTVGITENTAFYAQWTTNTYTVTYDPSGGTVDPASQVKLYGSTYGKASNGTTEAAMPTPVWAGHTFSGWYTAASGGTKITDSDTVDITENTAFYAQWTTNTYTVTYDPNGGTVSPTSQVKLYGSTYGKASNGTTEAAMPTPVWAGHTFSGWYTAASGGTKITNSDTVSITGNTTFYAQWTTNTYTVTYDPNSGSVDPASQVKLYGSIYGKASDGTTDEGMPTPALAGHTFSGWYTAASGGTRITDSGPVSITENTTFYAQWTTNTYTVTYDPSGGTVDPASQVKLYGSTYGKASDGMTDEGMLIPTWAGHTFSGWYTATSGGTKVTDSDTVDITENTAFYAHWTTNTYTVTYDPSSGTVSPASQVKLYGSTYGKASDGIADAPMPTPAWAGHTFTGWFTAASGGAKITDSDAVGITENTTFYAQWTTNTYTVTYDPNGGSVDSASQVKLYGSTYGKASDGTTDAAMPIPAWAGHTFSGWYTAASGGTKITDSDTVGIIGNTAFYAQWTTNTYTVTYDPSGGSFVSSITQDYNTQIDISPSSTKLGYIFVGWYADEALTNKVVFPYTITASVTLYARWAVEDTSDSGAKTITVSETNSGLFSDSEGTVKAEADMNNAFSSSVEVKVTDTDEKASGFGLISRADVYPFDISLYIKGTNTKTEPKDGFAVTISLPVPDKLLDVKEQLSVVHKSDDGTVTTLESQLRQINGVWYLTFEATEFSPYALVVNNAGTYDETAGLPYYVDSEGAAVFIGFAANGKYIAPSGTTVLFKENTKNFADIGSHWAKNYIDFVTIRELFTGTGENKFGPDTGMTRAMFATVIGRLYERSYGEIANAASGDAFTDVDYNGWYGKYVNWAADNSIITGIGGGLFAPDREITRQEMAAILYRFADFLGVLPSDMDAALNYSDAGTISSWAGSAALYCQSTGIITGRDGGRFVPKSTATRAEVAAMIERFVESVMA